MERVYHIQVLSKSQKNIYRIIKMHLDIIINISLLGIQANLVMIPSQLLNALHHLFLTNLAN